MRIAFLSDYISIHQIALCNAFYNLLGSDFTFIATTKISQARLNMGWYDYTKDVPYAIHLNDYSAQEFRERLQEFDVIILGSSHAKGVNDILRRKLVFYYQERPLKKGLRELANPKRLWTITRTVLRQSKRAQLLAASAFCYPDYKKLFCYRKRAWKWGYFIDPICESYQKRENNEMRILWVSRMLGWKHCEMAVYAAAFLKRKGIPFAMNLIGDGPQKSDIEKIIKKYALKENVHLLGNMPNAVVRKHMQQADVFLFTSDKREGWGVVLNEAMSAGCCVIASDAIGSAPFLISDGQNGYLFESENQGELNAKLLKVVKNQELCIKLAMEAVRTMNEVWSPSHAAKEFVSLSGVLLKGAVTNNGVSQSGPCSPA